jgi:hypothetical protein
VSHEEAHGHAAPTSPVTDSGFSPEEIANLRADDVGAAKSVVLLMCGVFTLGLILYSIVAYCCT